MEKEIEVIAMEEEPYIFSENGHFFLTREIDKIQLINNPAPWSIWGIRQLMTSHEGPCHVYAAYTKREAIRVMEALDKEAQYRREATHSGQGW